MLQPGKGVFHQMPIPIQTFIQIGVSFDGVALSGNDRPGSLRFNSCLDSLAVIALIRDDCPRFREPDNQFRRYCAIIDVSPGDFKINRKAMSVHHQMNLAGIACPAFPDCLPGFSRLLHQYCWQRHCYAGALWHSYHR